MKHFREVWAYVIVMFLSAGGALYVSMPQHQRTESNDIEWVKIDQKQIGSIKMNTSERTVEVSQRPSNSGTTSFWISVTESSVTESFRANDKLDQLTSVFSPLSVMREIGDPEALSLEEYGLKEPIESHLQIFSADRKVLLDFGLGKKAYGSQNQFVFDVTRRKVLLINAQVWSALDQAKATLFQRDIWNIPTEETTKAQLKFGEKSLDLVRVKKGNGQEILWARAEAADGTPDQSVSNLMRQIERLGIISYADESTASSLSSASSVFELKMWKNDALVVDAKFVTDPADAHRTFVTSDFLGGYGLLNSAYVEPILKDLAKL